MKTVYVEIHGVLNISILKNTRYITFNKIIRLLQVQLKLNKTQTNARHVKYETDRL